MLLYLDKIIYQKQETYQLLFENMSKWGATDDEIFYLYITFLNQNLNPNWIIFKIIFPILERKEMDFKQNPTAEIIKLGKINIKKMLTQLSKNKVIYCRTSDFDGSLII